MSVFYVTICKYNLFLNESDDASALAEDIKLEAVELLEALNIWYSEQGGKPPESGELSEDAVNAVFRPLHTLKGLCLMGGITSLEKLLHFLEDKIAAVRAAQISFSQELFDLLGDVLRAADQFFQHFPAPLPDELAVEVDLLMQTAQTLGDSPHFSETAAEEKFLLGADSASSAPSTAAAEDEEEADLTPSAAENLRFKEFCTRPENLLAAVYRGEEFSRKSLVQKSEGYENLTRVVEIIYERSVFPAGTLLVFGSDLDAEMAGSLGNVECVALERSDLALAALEEPWNLIAFDTTPEGTGEPAAQKENNIAPSPEKIEPDHGAEKVRQNKASAKTDSGPGQHAGATLNSADLYEDFDSTNGADNAAAMDLDQEMLDDFLTNADELLEQLSQSMLELESDPENSESVESIFRAAHTIKGTAGMFGFRAIEKLTHVMENTFDRIRKGELKAVPGLMDALLSALDRVRACFESLKSGKSAEISINDALNKVIRADFAAQNGIELDAMAGSGVVGANSGHGNAGGHRGQASNGAQPNNAQNAKASNHGGQSEDQRHGGTTANSGAGPVAEENLSPRASKADSLRAQEVADGTGKSKVGSKKKGGEVGTIRVDLSRLDALVNLVGELVIDRTRFARIEETLRASGQNSELLHTMSETLLLFGRHMNDVQSIIMKIRMVPVGNAFYKFTRVVRDLARTCGKEIDLVIEGGETELDKTLVEEIGDPLVHIIRNSADHGIETPDVRVKAGKNPRGTITLRAYQDGNMIVIFISDDGKGLPVDKIRQKAINVGLICENDQLGEKDIFNLIFEPGFSTAEKVTNISGRGVGMDAVKKSITKLKGVVEVDSIFGAGTQITIKLPLTLAIIPSLLVESFGETYAIPLVNVIESIRISPSEVQRIGHSDFVKLRERVVPLLRLGDVFELENLSERIWYSVQSSEENESVGTQESQKEKGQKNSSVQYAAAGRKNRSKSPRLIFVVVGVGEQRVGFIVDQLMGQQEIVIKSLGRILGRTRGVSGGCVLGNGRVALVLDVGELIEDHNGSSKGAQRVAV